MAAGQKSAVNTRKAKEVALDKDTDSNEVKAKHSCSDLKRHDEGGDDWRKTQRTAAKKSRKTENKNTKNTGTLRAVNRTKTSRGNKQQSNGVTRKQGELVVERTSSSRSASSEASSTLTTTSVSSHSATAEQCVFSVSQSSTSSSSVTSKCSNERFSDFGSEQNSSLQQQQHNNNGTTTASVDTRIGGANTRKTSVEENIQLNPEIPNIMRLFQKDNDGDTILHLAIVQENEQLTNGLIQVMRHRTLDIFNNMRQTPLHLAVITHQAVMVKWLVEAGADVNLMDRHGQTSLLLACKYEDIACVKAICDAVGEDKNKVKVDSRNFQGLAALHVATLSGNREVIQLVLNLGANINSQDTNSGRVALHHAVESGRQNIVEFLLSHGARVNAQTFAGNTALHTATGRDMDEIVKLLVSKGADVNISNIEGDLPRVVHSSEMAKRHFQTGGRRGKNKKN